MKTDRFKEIVVNVKENPALRIPQREGYEEIEKHFSEPKVDREVGVVLPVGCGKSGLITITPFALKAKRALVIAPGLRIKEQLADDFDPSNDDMFYLKCGVISGTDFPEPVVIEGKNTNQSDLEAADVVVTNIQQLQGEENRWLDVLSSDFFDLILVDEAHHNVADSWNRLRDKFPQAKIVNYSATPTRADGRCMEGKIIYSFPIFRAIEEGYIKRLKAKVLNPSTLKYIRNDNGKEIEVSIEEIRELGETDSEFRRSIVSSKETLNTIVDCSIRELYQLRKNTSEKRHKIIASALNYKHCIQITEAYKERDLRAEYIHSREEGAYNKRILKKLDNHELDVIVQVKMLSEGFDHRYLSVAAVCSIFSNLSPFVQFVGRIMRVIEPNSPDSLKNQGVVVFHAGANIANRWSDFQAFSEADQDYFDQLLPMEGLDFDSAEELEIEPESHNQNRSNVHIMDQESVSIEEIPLLKDDKDAQEAIDILRQKGYEVKLKPIPVTKQRKRLAARRALDDLIKSRAGLLLSKNDMNPGGMELDTKHLGKNNFVKIKSSIDEKCNALVGRKTGQRHDFSQEELDLIEENLKSIVMSVEKELFNA